MRLALASYSDLPEREVDDRPLHAALRDRGHEVHMPPWDAAIDWTAFDGVLIRTTWDYTARREAFVAWARSLGDRLLNPASVVAWNTHKGYLRELEAAGIAIVPTVWLEAGSDLATLAPERWPFPVDRPLFLKPCVGATAEGTARFDDGWTERSARWARELLARGDAMLQPFLDRVQTEGERSAILIDGQVTHWVRKVPVAGDYRVQDDHGASDGPHEPSPAERALVEQVRSTLAARLPGLLYARIDWLLDDEGPRINEVELVEPSLFFRHGPGAAEALADAWLARLQAKRG